MKLKNKNHLILLYLFALTPIFFIGCNKEDNKEEEKEEPQNTLGIEDKVLLWLDAKHLNSIKLNEDNEVSSWNSKMGDITATLSGSALKFEPITNSIIANFTGSLGVSNLSEDVLSFYLVGRIVDESSYSTILGNSASDDGVNDTRYLLREHSKMNYSGEVNGFFNKRDTLVNTFKENLPGNLKTHLFYADFNVNDISSDFYIGSKGNGQGGKFAYNEVIVLKEALNVKQKDSVLNYLLDKWDIN